MDVGTIFPYINYMPGSGDFGEGSLYAFNTSTDKGQFVLSPSFQIASHTGAYPVSDPILKRFTVQVAPLDYAAAGATPDALLTTDVQSTKVLMDFNTEDLYTKQRNSTDWDGSWPQFNRNYANITYGGDDANTIRPIKGAPVRFRKIPLCTTQGTGYFYALASAPYIMTGALGGGEALSQETGYLSDWDPSQTQLSIDCCGANITGNNLPVPLEMTYDESLLQIYSNVYSGVTKNEDTCTFDLTFRSITGIGSITTSGNGNIIYISGASENLTGVTGADCTVGTYQEGGTIYIKATSNFYDSVNDSNVIQNFVDNTCGSGINFYNITGTAGVGAVTNIDGKDYINITGGSFSKVTGTDCTVRTYQEGGTIYITGNKNFYDSVNDSNVIQNFVDNTCGSGINFYNITGTEVGAEITNIDGKDYINITGGSFSKVTGTDCTVGTYQEGDTIYITGNKNFYDSVNDSNIVQNFTDNTCGSGINFYNITGTNGVGSEIKNIGGKDYINITGSKVTTGLVNITGQNCIETRIEEINSEDYITINFTGQVVTTGNLDTSNLFATPGMSTDSNGCSSNSKILKLKSLIGTTGIGVINHDDDNLNVGMDCPFGGSDGWDADPGDSNTPGNNNPLHDCGFRLQCVELCDGAGNTYAAMIPLRYLAADGTWSATPVNGSTCP